MSKIEVSAQEGGIGARCLTIYLPWPDGSGTEALRQPVAGHGLTSRARLP